MAPRNRQNTPPEEKENEVTTPAPTTPAPTAPAVDFAGLAEMAVDAEPIQRKRKSGVTGPNPFDKLVKDTFGKTRALPPVDGKTAKQVVTFLRAAAASNTYSLSLDVSPKEYKDETPRVVVRFSVKAGRVKNGTVTCPICGKEITVTHDNKVRVHKNGKDKCKGSNAAVAPEPATTPTA